METAVLQPQHKQFVPKREIESAKTIPEGDLYAISLIEEALKEPRVSREDVIRALKRK